MPGLGGGSATSMSFACGRLRPILIPALPPYRLPTSSVSREIVVETRPSSRPERPLSTMYFCTTTNSTCLNKGNKSGAAIVSFE
jgi:hypothetical protein